MVLLANPRVLEENLPSDQQQNCKVLHMHILEHNKHNIKIESVDRLRIGRTNITKDSNLIMLKSIQFLNASQTNKDLVQYNNLRRQVSFKCH